METVIDCRNNVAGWSERILDLSARRVVAIGVQVPRSCPTLPQIHHGPVLSNRSLPKSAVGASVEIPFPANCPVFQDKPSESLSDTQHSWVSRRCPTNSSN